MAPPRAQPPAPLMKGSKAAGKRKARDDDDDQDDFPTTQGSSSRPPKRKATLKAKAYASAGGAAEDLEDDAEYEPEEEERKQTAASKKATSKASKSAASSTTKGKKPTTRSKAKAGPNLPEGDLPQVLNFVEFEQEPVPIAATPYTWNLNNFLKVREELVQSRPVQYTPLGHAPCSILDLPSRTDRRFEISGPVRHLQNRERRGKGVKNGPKVQVHQVNVRVCPIRDALMPEAPTIIAFGEEPVQPKLNNSPRTSGPLSDDVCPDDQTCMRLTQLVCDILNKMPKELDQKLANNPIGIYYPDLALAEVIAMQHLLPDGDFDHTRLYSFLTEGRNSRYGKFKGSITKGPSKTVLRSTYYAIGGSNKRASRYVGDIESLQSIFQINMDDLDVTKENDVPKVPTWFAFTPAANNDEEDQSNKHAARDMTNNLLAYGSFQMFGKVGTEAQQNRAWKDLIGPFYKTLVRDARGYARTIRREGTGVLDGSPLLLAPDKFTKSYTYSGVRFHMPAYAMSCVENASDLVKVLLQTSSKVMIAFVYQTFHNAFISGVGLVNALQTLYVTADLVNQGLITRQYVLDTYCSCKTADHRNCFEHYCMRCIILFGCFQMLRTDDGRIFCKRCSETGSGRWNVDDDFHIDSIPKHLRLKLVNLFRKDAKAKGVQVDQSEIDAAHEQLMLTLDAEEGTWQDGYDGQRNFKQSVYQEAVTNRYSLKSTVHHPHYMTVEGVLQGVIVDGVSWYHHWRNVIKTAISINVWKAQQIPGIIPWFSTGMQLTLAEKGGAARDMQFWDEFDQTVDHSYVIASILPKDKGARLQEIHDIDHENLKNMQTSAVWDGKTLPKGERLFTTRALATGTNNNRRSRAEAFQMIEEGKPDRQPFVMPTVEQVNNVKAFGEDVRRSKLYNPKGLAMPLAPGGLPYFWNKRYLPHDDTSEEYEKWIFQFLYRSYVTWDEDCDPDVVHEESVCTLHCLLIVQWYQNEGGFDPMFKCQMSPYVGHGTRSSFGRRDTVLPGSPLRSGMLVLYPKSLADFDDAKRTAQVELWAMNVYKFDMPVTGNMNVIPLLQQTMAELAPSTPHYNPVDLTVKRMTIPFPTQSTRKADGKSTVWMRGSSRVYGADLSKLVAGTPSAESNQGAISELEVEEQIELGWRDEAGAEGELLADVMDDADDFRKV